MFAAEEESNGHRRSKQDTLADAPYRIYLPTRPPGNDQSGVYGNRYSEKPHGRDNTPHDSVFPRTPHRIQQWACHNTHSEEPGRPDNTHGDMVYLEQPETSHLLKADHNQHRENALDARFLQGQ